MKEETTLPIKIEIPSDERKIMTKALIDSGATGSCIKQEFVEKHNIPLLRLPRPIKVINIDGTHNIKGPITHYARLRLVAGSHSEQIDLAVTGTGSDIVLGHDWLRLHNPNINWQQGGVTFDRCPLGHVPPIEIRAHSNIAMDLAIESEQKKPTKSFEEIVPVHYRNYRDLFDKKEFDTLPERRPWDHAIDLKPGFEPKDCKTYPLAPQEKEKLDKFLDENLRTGRIRPSQSPQASPFFFVKKKDGKDL